MSRENLLPAEFAELKRRAAGGTDFPEFWEYFLSNFVERPGFCQIGRPIAVEQVEVLEAMAGMMMEREGPVTARNLFLIEVPRGGIVHGSGIFDGRLACVLFIPELDVGMMALWASQGVMKYARFWLRSPQMERRNVA
jgi:hypothetical protein